MRKSLLTLLTLLGAAAQASPLPCDAPCRCSYTFSLTPLYWRVGEERLDYAITNDIANNNIPDGRINSIDPQWDWGGRADLALLSPNRCWDVNVNYTYLYSSSTDTTNRATLIYPTSLLPGFVIGFDSGQSNWHINYNMANAEWGYLSYLSCLDVRSHIGCTLASIRQRVNVIFVDATPTVVAAYRKNNFFGGGPRAGVDVTRSVWRCLDIVGRLSAAILWGEFSVSEHEHLVDTTTNLNSSTSYQAFCSNFQAALGLQSKWQYGQRACLHFAGLWDFVYWPGQNQMLQFVNDLADTVMVTNHGDLWLTGPSLRVDMTF